MTLPKSLALLTAVSCLLALSACTPKQDAPKDAPKDAPAASSTEWAPPPPAPTTPAPATETKPAPAATEAPAAAPADPPAATPVD